jgi:ribonucleotide reductase alpha subunit
MTTAKKIARTGRVQDWIDNPESRLPVSCTTFVVRDSMEGPDGIEASWRFVSHALRNGAGCAVHLSNLRPEGDENGRGLTASGPVSFARVYSVLNETLRRGGVYKNGAVVLHLDYTHPDAIKFIKAKRSELPWAKRCLNVDQNFLEKASPELIEACLKTISNGDLWLMKMTTDKQGARIYGNVCVSGDALVQTTEGPRKIRDLVGRRFTAIVNGIEQQSSERGAWSNGYKQTYSLETTEGFSLRATADHKVMTPRGWMPMGHLLPGDKICLHQHRSEASTQWQGKGNHDEGWLLGWLLADGTYSSDQSAKLDFYGSKKNLLDGALKKLATLDGHLQGDQYSAMRTGSHAAHADRTSVNSVGLARMAVEYGISRANKTATELLEETSADFHRGFLEAYFSADGTVSLGNANGNGKSIGVTSSCLRNLQMIQRMLLRFGIRSRIWRERYNGGMTMMPDGKGGQKLYQTKKASRLDISGQVDLRRFAAFIGFTLPEKQEKLDKLIGSYRKVPYEKAFVAKVESIEPYGIEEVFDCSIPGAGAFDANGIYVSNCLEVLLPSRGTCLLQHVNLGACQVEDLVKVYPEAMKELCELHAKTGVGETGEYLSPEVDKQVGLGVLGLANFLAQNGVSYEDLGKALEVYLDGPDSQWSEDWHGTIVGDIVYALNDGIESAAEVAREYGMQRAFCIAPTASCSYRHTDLRGYITAPEISPPIGRSVDRDSGTLGVKSVDYPPDCEIASEVGWENYKRVADGIVRLYQGTGLFHGFSFNSWSDVVTYDKDFLSEWLASPQTSLYYALQVMPDTQAKDDALAALDEGFRDFFRFSEIDASAFEDDEEVTGFCPNDGSCSSCAE